MNYDAQKYGVVMIIDDNIIDTYIAKKIIMVNEFAKETINFTGVQEGFNYIFNILDESQLPEIILLDLHLDGLNGFDFLELFEGLPSNKKSKMNVFVVSSTIDPIEINKIQENPNVKGFCEKYINKEFLNHIQRSEKHGFNYF
jgi:CheY-like chemotaxis protein